MFDSSKHAELEKLISETTDVLTYTKWLEGKREMACSKAGDSYREILNTVDSELSKANIDKNELIQGFYAELSDHHTFLEDYAAA